ncbi:MAG TPA: SRPBCC family protein [Rhodocyclaceae bacterium]
MQSLARNLLCAVSLFAAAGLAQAAKVSESVLLDATPDAVWKLAGDFDGLNRWHPAVTGVEISKGKNNVPGAVRDLTLKDGAKIVETLLSHNAKGHSMKYRIDQSPLPVTGYVSTLSVKAEGKGSRVTWSSAFTVPEAAKKEGVTDAKAQEIIAGIYTAGFDALKAKLAGQ